MVIMREAAERSHRLVISPIRLLHADGTPWRVEVEAWPGAAGWQGRFVFLPSRPTHGDRREGPVRLQGTTREELLAGAHEVPEHRLRALLWSLG
jgi:hypothetical protein